MEISYAYKNTGTVL